MGWQLTNQDIKLIGVVYLDKHDLLPTFLYGNTYDELIFRTPIRPQSIDVFTYSQTASD